MRNGYGVVIPPLITALPTPVVPETLPMPTDDGLGLDKMKGFSPIRPNTRQGHPKQSIYVCQSRSWVTIFQYRQLLAQNQILCRQRPSSGRLSVCSIGHPRRSLAASSSVTRFYALHDRRASFCPERGSDGRDRYLLCR